MQRNRPSTQYAGHYKVRAVDAAGNGTFTARHLGTIAWTTNYSALDPSGHSERPDIIDPRTVVEHFSAKLGACTPSWIDLTLGSTGTIVKAAHFNELLTTMNCILTAKGLSQVSFAPPSPATAVKVLASHITTLRAALR